MYMYMHIIIKLINIDRSFAERKVQTVDIGMQTDCEEVAVIPPVIPHEDLQDR